MPVFYGQGLMEKVKSETDTSLPEKQQNHSLVKRTEK